MQNNPYLQVNPEEVMIGFLAGAIASVGMLGPWLYNFPTILYSAAAITGLAGAVVAARQRSIDHVRGVLYLPDLKAGLRALQERERQLMSQAQREKKLRGMEIAGMELARKREVGHMYLVGLPGAGKTVLLTALIDQILARLDKLLLHDPKGDFTSWLLGLLKERVVLLGPWDARAAIWDVSRDVDSPARAVEFARIVVGDGGKENAFFYNSARRLLAALVQALPAGWNWGDLYEALIGDPAKLVHMAATRDQQIPTAFPSFFAQGGRGEVSTTEKNIFSLLAERTSWIGQIAAVDQPDKRRFSIREWLISGGEIGTVILNNNPNFQSAAEALFGAILSVAAAIVASADLPEISADLAGTWLVLDEFPQLGEGAMAHIQKIEELGRSRGVRVVKALQDESQLTAMLGRDKALPILSLQSTRIYCRVSDHTAREVSQRLGEREIRRYTTTAENGAIQGKQAIADRQQVINPSDLLGLKETPQGIEILVHIEDTMGRLVQPFPPRREITGPAFSESIKWRNGPRVIVQFAQPEPSTIKPEIKKPAVPEIDAPEESFPDQDIFGGDGF